MKTTEQEAHSKKSPWLAYAVILAPIVWFGVSNLPSLKEAAGSKTAEYLQREDDIGCKNMETVRSALRQPLKWVRKPNGAKGFYLAFADAYSFGEMNSIGWGAKEEDANCVYVGPHQQFVLQMEETELVCLQRIEPASGKTCYWVPKAPPSSRAEPTPNE